MRACGGCGGEQHQGGSYEDARIESCDCSCVGFHNVLFRRAPPCGGMHAMIEGQVRAQNRRIANPAASCDGSRVTGPHGREDLPLAEFTLRHPP
jgi:hypothetical protein